MWSSWHEHLHYAMAASTAIGDRAIVVAPTFEDKLPARDASDWNDLVRIAGKEVAVQQLSPIIRLLL